MNWLSRLAPRVPERNLVYAAMTAIFGCLVMGLAIYYLGWGNNRLAVLYPILGLVAFVQAAIYALPNHRRGDKVRLQAVSIVLSFLLAALIVVLVLPL